MASSMIYRELFNEMPYAACLDREFLASRCSTCFADQATFPCDTNGCVTVFYCSEQCRVMDRVGHKYECTAFKKSEGGIESFVRLLGRILTRRLSDGGVAHLCEKFPDNIPDRSLGDLMSHQSDITKCKYRSKEMVETLNEFGLVFSNTPLVDDWKLVKRTYCVMWTNCFTVSGDLDMKSGSGQSMGLGFYLNISRFNHSCSPDLFIFFRGSRLAILYVSVAIDEDESIKERLALTRSTRKFNRLTINYGYGSCYNDSYFPLRRDRRASLQFAYYFKCQCVLCSDERGANLEEHAAPIECRKCGEPYVWMEIGRRSALKCWQPTRTTRKCRKSCSCISNGEEADAVKAYIGNVNPEEKLKALEKEWEHTMSTRMEHQVARKIIERCEPVWEMARSLWHRVANLRMHQLNERLFAAYSVLVRKNWKANGTADSHCLNMALMTGEDSMAWFKKINQKSCDSVMAAYAYELAQLYEISACVGGTVEQSVDGFKRASYWYTFAASVWSSYGQYASTFVQQLTNDSAKANRSAMEIRAE